MRQNSPPSSCLCASVAGSTAGLTPGQPQVTVEGLDDIQVHAVFPYGYVAVNRATFLSTTGVVRSELLSGVQHVRRTTPPSTRTPGTYRRQSTDDLDQFDERLLPKEVPTGKHL